MSAAKVLAAARAELGVVESPPGSNRTKYGRAYGTDGVAWCAIFLWWVFRQAGQSPLVPKTAYTPTMARWFQDRGRWGTSPRLGAVVFFDFPGDGVDRISHVGIVESVQRDGTILTIEGNTSSGTAGSQRDGGGVYRRARRTGIVGYGYPAYPGPAAVAAARPTIRRGDTGPAVELWQRFLGVAKKGIPGYGTFGPATHAATERYQRMRGLTVDGVVGPATWRASQL